MDNWPAWAWFLLGLLVLGAAGLLYAVIRLAQWAGAVADVIQDGEDELL